MKAASFWSGLLLIMLGLSLSRCTDEGEGRFYVTFAFNTPPYPVEEVAEVYTIPAESFIRSRLKTDEIRTESRSGSVQIRVAFDAHETEEFEAYANAQAVANQLNRDFEEPTLGEVEITAFTAPDCPSFQIEWPNEESEWATCRRRADVLFDSLQPRMDVRYIDLSGLPQQVVKYELDPVLMRQQSIFLDKFSLDIRSAGFRLSDYGRSTARQREQLPRWADANDLGRKQAFNVLGEELRLSQVGSFSAQWHVADQAAGRPLVMKVILYEGAAVEEVATAIDQWLASFPEGTARPKVHTNGNQHLPISVKGPAAETSLWLDKLQAVLEADTSVMFTQSPCQRTYSPCLIRDKAAIDKAGVRDFSLATVWEMLFCGTSSHHVLLENESEPVPFIVSLKAETDTMDLLHTIVRMKNVKTSSLENFNLSKLGRLETRANTARCTINGEEVTPFLLVGKSNHDQAHLLEAWERAVQALPPSQEITWQIDRSDW